MRVVSNTAISLDGRITTGAAERQALGSRTDRDYMSVLRAHADAVLVGGETLRTWPLPLVPDEAALRRLSEVGFPDAEAPVVTGRTWWNVVMTRTMRLPETPRFWLDPRVRPLVFSPTPGAVPRGEVRVGDTSVRAVVTSLEALGVRSLLLECGGDLLHQFLAADLVDTLHLTLCPRIVGRRGAPGLADGDLFGNGGLTGFRLQANHAVGDEVFLRYVR